MANNQTDIDKCSLRGPVRSVTTEWHTKPGIPSDELEFDEHGNVTRVNSGITETTEITSDGARILTQAASGSDFWSMDGLHRAGFTTHRASVVRTRFDPDGIARETAFLDASGGVLSIISYRADAYARIREAIQYAGQQVPAWADRMVLDSEDVRRLFEPGNEQARAMFQYDDAGHLTSMQLYYIGQLVHSEIRAYNDHGDVLTKTNDDGSVTYEYRYDHWGNWVHRIGTAGDPPLVVCDETRVISYYGDRCRWAHRGSDGRFREPSVASLVLIRGIGQ